MKRAVTITAIALMSSGCAFGDGEHFAVLSPRIEAELAAPADRDLGGGWQKLASDYEIRIDAISVDADHIGLIDAAAGGASFDPAAPPPGYSNCHNGHCHADSGGLVPYDEIEEMLGEGGAGGGVVAALPVGELDLAGGASRPLACTPSCGLPLADITAARMEVVRVTARGAVRDGRAEPRIDGEIPWQLDTRPDAPVLLLGDLHLPADREHDPDVALELHLEPSAAIFDDIAWDAASDDPDGFDLGADEAAHAAVLAALAQVELGASIRR